MDFIAKGYALIAAGFLLALLYYATPRTAKALGMVALASALWPGFILFWVAFAASEEDAKETEDDTD